MLKILTDHLKTENICKNTVKRFFFIIECVPDQYKTQKNV